MAMVGHNLDFPSLSVGHLCPRSSCELNSCTELPTSQKCERLKVRFSLTLPPAFLTSDGTAVDVNSMDKGFKTMFIETSSSDTGLTALKPCCSEGKTMAFVPNVQVFSTGRANSTVQEHNRGKFVMKCQAEGDPDVTVRQALFPVEAPAHRVLSHVMYLKRQTFQESGMNSFSYANNAKSAEKLSPGDKYPSVFDRNVKVCARHLKFYRSCS